MNSLQKTTIMLVDDDKDLLYMMKQSLEKEGYNVGSRTSAPGKKDIVDTHPAVIFMDVNLSGENGAALCRAIKHDAAASDTPVVLISGDDDDLLHQEAASGHADGCIGKPFRMEELNGLAAYYARVPKG